MRTDIQTVTPEAAPALAIDAQLGAPRVNGRIERAITWNLLRHLAANGWNVSQVYDGEEFTRCTEPRAAMELIFNLDEVSVRFRKTKRAITHGVLLVLGNGEDIVSDWNYSEGDADGFNAVMNAFDAESIAPALLGSHT